MSDNEFRFCKSCGKKLESAAKFCNGCGTPVDLDSIKSQNIDKKPLSDKKNHKHKMAILGLIMILAISIIGIFIYAYKDTIFNTRDKNEASVPQKVFSGTKAFDITPLEGVRLTAAENALDKERQFEVTRLDDTELFSKYDIPGEDSFPVAGFKIDAGMKDDELLPGYVTVELDLKKLQIPEEMWEQVRVDRIDSKGDKTEMVSSNHNGVLQFNIRKNSIFITSILTGALGLVIKYGYDETIREKYGTGYTGSYSEYKLDISYDKDDKEKNAYFRLIWPDTLKPANPEEIERVDKASKALWERHGWTDENKSKWKMQGSGYYISKYNEIVQNLLLDKEYVELSNLVKSDEWLYDNFFPKRVSPVVKALKYASIYLYKNKQFKLPWYRIDILMKDIWPQGDTALAYERDLTFTFPFIDINACKDFFDQNDINMTVLHELFHAVQKEYYGYCPDKKNYLWFMESTALTLENEANKDYSANGWNTVPDILRERDAWETFRNPLPDPGDITKVAQEHGYTLSLFFEFLRDNADFNKTKKDDFVKNLMEAFSGFMASPVSAIYDGCGSTKDELGKQFLEFANAKATDMRFFINDRVKNPDSCHSDISMLKEIGQSLDADNFYYNWEFNAIKPLSVEYRLISLAKIARDNLKNSYVYITNSTGAGFKTNNIYHNININGNTDWIPLENDYKMIEGDNLKELSIQRIDSNVLIPWFNPSAANLRVILMLQPTAPKLTLNDNKLRIDIVPGTLKKGPYTISYEVYIKSPGSKKPYTIQLDSTKQSQDVDIGKLNKEYGINRDSISVTYVECVFIPEGEMLLRGPESNKAEIGAVADSVWTGTWTREDSMILPNADFEMMFYHARTQVVISPYNTDGYEYKIERTTVTNSSKAEETFPGSNIFHGTGPETYVDTVSEIYYGKIMSDGSLQLFDKNGIEKDTIRKTSTDTIVWAITEYKK
jgi:hypothetical protein